MHTFKHLLDWRLKAGSHQFPGPDGGTCINEAAIVAVGLPYRPIRSASQMPECFSRPICEYVMWLNDLAFDNDRQRLLPYVTRLACADSPEVEKKRAAYLAQHGRRFWFAPYINMDAELGVLDRVLAIGRQADTFPDEEIEARLRAARAEEVPGVEFAKATVPNSKCANSILSDIRMWLQTSGSAQETVSLVP